MTTWINLPDELHQAIRSAVAATDSPWRLDRGNTQHRTTQAVADAVWDYLTTATDQAEERGYRAGRKEATHDAGRAKADGYAAGRAAALQEAATMLKRHGHRTAVDRVQALATPTVGTDTGQVPAGAPRPATEPRKGASAPGTPAPCRGRPETEVFNALTKALEGHG